MASAVGWRIYMSNIRKILMLENVSPLAVRRQVSFCEAVHNGRQTIESVEAVKIEEFHNTQAVWDQGKIAVAVDPEWTALKQIQPHVVVDAILAKKNMGTRIQEAPLVIGLGPGFVAGRDVHLVIETNRGHNLGRIITWGPAESNTGIPGFIDGYSEERVLRAPGDGQFITDRSIGNLVKKGEVVGLVAAKDVTANIDGVIRGLIRSGSLVYRGLKIGDIDSRADVDYCTTISDKARAIAGSVLEAILRHYN
jgi:xanthine dehydrogenase accessory factor